MIGKNIARTDAKEKVTGSAVYITDMESRFPGIYHVKALRSPYAHARIKKIDTSRAKSLQGVACVITGSEPGVKWELFPPQSRLAKDEAIWAGQAVALVAADTPRTADEALGRISVEYEPLPHVLDWESAFSDDPVSVVDPDTAKRQKDSGGMFTSPNVAGEYHLIKGDVESAFKRSDVIVEGEFSAGKKTHCQLECAMSITEYHEDGRITIWCNGCGIHNTIKARICNALDLPAAGVRVIQPLTGGSFGNRNVPYVEILSALMALKAKRTVCFKFSRTEMFIAAPSNWTCATKIKLGATSDGKIIAKQVRLIEEIGASAENTAYTGRTSSSSLTSVYAIPNVRMDTCSLLTNTVPAGSYRGLGAPEALFGLECMIDELAEKLNMSPAELRLKNLIRKGGCNDYGEKITSTGVEKCLKAVAEEIKPDELPEQTDLVWKKGRGISCACKQNAPNGRAEAEVRVYHDGSIQLLLSLDREGMGVSTALIQIAADTLRVSPDRIQAVESDTLFTPYDNLSASSRSIYTTGNAVRFACRDAIEQLKEAAARYAGVHTDMVDIRNHTAYITGSNIEQIPLSELFAPLSPAVQNNWGLKRGTPVIGRGLYSPAPSVPFDKNGLTPRMWNWFQYAATAVEVGVNIRTGQIKVLRIANAADSGNPINPKLVESQIDGASLMAIGFSLQEEHIYDENGMIINTSFGEYRLPTVLDMPANDNAVSLICPDPLPDGPYGAKGMSESVVSAVNSAIAAAVYKAAGIRLRYYPMTAERVLRALAGKGDIS